MILWAVRWYLQFPISDRDLEQMPADRGVTVDHTTLERWVEAYAPDLDQRLRPHLRMTTGSRRFLRKARKQAHTVNPRTLTVDKNAAYPSASKTMKKNGELWRFTKLRQVKYLNNIVEQDHRDGTV